MEKTSTFSTQSANPIYSEETPNAPIKVQDPFKENWQEDRREGLRELSQELRHNAERLAERVETRVRGVYDRSRNWARENPRTAMGLAGAVGLAALGGVFAWWYTTRRNSLEASPASPSPPLQSVGGIKRSAYPPTVLPPLDQ